jgi:hypothetical protein
MDRRELLAEAGRGDLVEMLGLDEILEPMQPEVG